jgi:hypothetical protein
MMWLFNSILVGLVAGGISCLVAELPPYWIFLIGMLFGFVASNWKGF